MEQRSGELPPYRKPSHLLPCQDSDTITPPPYRFSLRSCPPKGFEDGALNQRLPPPSPSPVSLRSPQPRNAAPGFLIKLQAVPPSYRGSESCEVNMRRSAINSNEYHWAVLQSLGPGLTLFKHYRQQSLSRYKFSNYLAVISTK